MWTYNLAALFFIRLYKAHYWLYKAMYPPTKSIIILLAYFNNITCLF